MSLIGFVPEVWSAMVLAPFERSLVYGSLANRNVDGDIRYGKNVHIPTIGKLSAVPYTGTITYGSIPANERILEINQAQVVAVEVTDIAKAQSKPDLLGALTTQMSVALQQSADSYIASLHADAGVVAGLGTTATPLAVNSANILAVLARIGQLLDEQDVPRADRWIVVPPWFGTKLLLAKIARDTANSDALARGFYGSVCGFAVYVSNNVAILDGTKAKILAGVGASITFAGQIETMEALRLQNQMSDGLRALYVYGARVTQPTSLACLTATEATEP